jgi:hypothetical protein
MAMIMYCWHALKLEGVHCAITQPCVHQIHHNMKTLIAVAQKAQQFPRISMHLVTAK